MHNSHSIRAALRGLSAIALLVCAASTAQAQGNMLDMIGPNAKAAGRGGASTAVADDSLSAARNPALLTQIPGSRADISFVISYDRYRERSEFKNDTDSSLLPWPIPSIGFTTDYFALDVEDDPDFDELDDYRPSPGPYVSFGLHQPIMGAVAPTVTIAGRLGDKFSLGASLNILTTWLSLEGGGGGVGGGSSANSFIPNGTIRVHYQADGTAVVPPQNFDAGTGQDVTWAEIFDLADSAGGAASEADDENDALEFKLSDITGVGIAGAIGCLWTPRDDLSIGFNFRTPGILFNPSGTAEIDITRAIRELEDDPNVGLLIGSVVDTYLPNRGQNGFKTEFDAETDYLMTPMSISFGVAWWIVPRWMVTVDLRWINWSMGFDEIELKGSGPDNQDLIEVNGGSDISYTFNLKWKDQFVVAVGSTVAINENFLVRFGYNYNSQSQPDEFVTLKSFSIQHRLTLGTTLRWGDVDFDFAYLYGLPIQVDKKDESFRIEQHQFYFGLGYQF